MVWDLGFNCCTMPALSLLNSAKLGDLCSQLEQKKQDPMDMQIQGNPTGVNYFQARRAKRVSDPLNEIVRAILCGNIHGEMQEMSTGHCISSGSEHEAESLLSFVCGFIDDEEDLVCSRRNCLNDNADDDSENESEESNSAHILESLVCCKNAVELHLLGYVTQAVEVAKAKERFNHVEAKVSNRCIRREVMDELKRIGYNAGICKSRLHHIRDFPAGDYEYIDVIMEGRNTKREERILVDIDFSAQFEVARPTNEYSALLRLLPNIFVGKADRLHQIIKIMCDAAKRSLKKERMHIPPWRKYNYMRSNWLASYRRTTKNIAVNSPNFDLPHGEWQPPSANASKHGESGKVSGLANALTQPPLASPVFENSFLTV